MSLLTMNGQPFVQILAFRELHRQSKVPGTLDTRKRALFADKHKLEVEAF